MIKKPQVAIVGIGKWGKNILDTFVRQGANVPYCVHCGSIEETLWLTKKYPETRIVPFDKMLANKQVNSIALATPIVTHFELAMKALKAGKHVFVEKPGASNWPDTAILFEEASKRNRVLAVGLIFAFHPVLNVLKEQIDGKKILSVHFSWNKWGTFNEDIIFNLFAHDASILAALGIELEKKSININILPAITVGDIFDLRAMGKRGESVMVHLNRVSPDKRKAIVVVCEEEIYIWLNETLMRSESGQAPQEIPILRAQPPLDLEVADFLSAIAGQKLPLVDAKFVALTWANLERCALHAQQS